MSDKLVYECEFCEEQLGPKATFCSRCGQEFDEAVPLDAALPVRKNRVASDKLIYECEFCEEPLGPKAGSCPRCKQEFDEAVPSDAALPMRLNQHGTSRAARQTIVLEPRRRASRLSPHSLFSRLPSLRRLKQRLDL